MKKNDSELALPDAEPITIQFATELLEQVAPSKNFLLKWAQLAMQRESCGCTIRLVDQQEIQLLNRKFRERDTSTNVLSFEAGLPPEIAHGYLGDVVICVPVVVNEAIAQNKTADAHFAHMVVHGVLHLRGYDHIESEEALVMEQLESHILTSHGFGCPYIDSSGDNASSHG